MKKNHFKDGNDLAWLGLPKKSQNDINLSSKYCIFGMAKKWEAKTFQLGSKCWKWENVIKTLLSKASPLWYFFIFGSDEIFDLLWHKCKYFDYIFYSSALCLVYKHWTFCYGFCQCLMVILFSKNLQFGNSIRFNPMMQNIRCQTWCFSEGDLNF